MNNDSGTIKERLRQIAADLLSLAESVDSSEKTAKEPPTVREKLARRECLQTGEIVPKGKLYRRGLSPAAYQRTINMLRAKEVTESDLISRGLLAEVRKKGRSGGPSALDEFLASRQSADASKYIEKAAELSPKKKRTPAKRTS